VLSMLMDKAGFAAYGAAAGLPVPRTEVLTNRADAERVAAGVCYPCLLKPATKTASWLAHTSAKAVTVGSRAELLSVYDALAGWSGCLVLQEWVEGPETELYSCNAYFGAGGRPLATFVARKLRQWPPRVGTSASGEECRNDEVRDTTLRLFGGLGFQGLAYLEMKRDARTGRHIIIEPNIGRPTGRSAIAEAGGVELLYTAYCDAAGLPLPSARVQRYTGATWLDLRRDAQAAWVAHRQGSLTFSEWLRWLRGPKAHAIWSLQDPKPFLSDLVRASKGGARRALGVTARSDLQLSEPVGAGRGVP
jgi:D-aspartate ligase